MSISSFGCTAVRLLCCFTVLSMCWMKGSSERSTESLKHEYATCYSIPYYAKGTSDGGHLLITKCPSNASTWRQECEGIPTHSVGIIPVTGASNNLTYRNIFCAHCHSQGDVLRWMLAAKCKQAVGRKRGFHGRIPVLTDCTDVSIAPPLGKIPVLKHCSADFLGKRTSTETWSIAGDMIEYESAPQTFLHGYSALFNFGFDGHSNLLLTDNYSPNSFCSGSNELWNPFDRRCMQIECPPDYMSVDGQCVPRAQAVSRIVQSSQPDRGSNSTTATKGYSWGGGAGMLNMCINIRLSVASAARIAAAEEKFREYFGRVSASLLVNRVSLSLLTPLLSSQGHCSSDGVYSLKQNENARKANQSKQLLQERQLYPLPSSDYSSSREEGDEISCADETSTAMLPEMMAKADSRTSELLEAGSMLPVAAMLPISQPIDARELRQNIVSAMLNAGLHQPGAGGKSIKDSDATMDKRESFPLTGANACLDESLSKAFQVLTCDAPQQNLENQWCNESSECMMSLKVTISSYTKKPMIGFVVQTLQKSFETFFNTSSDGRTHCVEGLTHEEQAGWCQGMTVEYINDQFEVLWSNDSEILGIRVFLTGNTYAVGQFQYTVDLDKKYWQSKNITQIATACERMPKINETNCPRLTLRNEDYHVLPNFSIAATYLSTYPQLYSLPSYKELYTQDEYEYVLLSSSGRNVSDASNDSTSSGQPSTALQICMPIDLIDDYVAKVVKDRVHVTTACSFLEEFSRVSALLGLACTAVSLVAMAVTFATYAAFRSLRTVAGASIMNLTATEISSQLAFLIGSYANVGRDECVVIAIIAHYFLLASFFWTNVMAYINYRSFGSDLRARLEQQQRPGGHSRRCPLLTCYATYAYAVPAIGCATCVALNFTTDPSIIGYGTVLSVSVVPVHINGTMHSLSVQYRNIGCWIENPMATLLSFGVPLLYCLVVNVMLFARTVHGMRAYQRDSRRNSEGTMATGSVLRSDSRLGRRRKEPSQLSIQVRLSALYGFSWVFGIVIAVVGTRNNKSDDGETDLTCYVLHILSFFFNLLNGCTGTFIFFAFTFNKRILQLYKAKFFRHPKVLQGSSKTCSASQQTISSLIGSSATVAVQ